MEKVKYWGLSLHLDIKDCNAKIIKDPKKIKKYIIDVCQKIKMKRYGEAMVERFADGPLEGWSALQFIETSSITLHNDEEKNRMFVDIFSCKAFDTKMATEFSCKFFKGKKRRAKVLKRF